MTIPVSVFKSAEQVDDVSLKTLHAKCKTPLKFERACPTCNIKLESGSEDAATMQAFEFAPGQFVTVNRTEIEKAIHGKRLTLDRMVPAGDLEAAMLDETYWVGPSSDPRASRAYDALMRALEQTNRVGIGRFALNSRERVAVVRPVTSEGVTLLGLTTLYPVAGVRLADATEIRDQVAQAPATAPEVALFSALVEELTVTPDFRWRAIRRFYPPRIRKLLEGKQKTGTVVAPLVDTIAPDNLEQTLKASVKAAKAKAAPKAKV